jgi:carbon-monoxide dehydrogenase medium subunit
MAHADPSAEQPLAMLTLGGELVAVGPKGRRTIAADDFFLGMFTTALEPDEVLVEVRFPVMDPRAGYAVVEFARRKGDFAIVAIAAVLRRDGARCVEARIAASGVSGNPVRLAQAEAALLRDGLGDDAIARAAAAAQEVDPMSDPNGSADYRRHLVRVLTKRAAQRALARAA